LDGHCSNKTDKSPAGDLSGLRLNRIRRSFSTAWFRCELQSMRSCGADPCALIRWTYGFAAVFSFPYALNGVFRKNEVSHYHCLFENARMQSEKWVRAWIRFGATFGSDSRNWIGRMRSVVAGVFPEGPGSIDESPHPIGSISVHLIFELETLKISFDRVCAFGDRGHRASIPAPNECGKC
jgi:hypothetical protein